MPGLWEGQGVYFVRGGFVNFPVRDPLSILTYTEIVCVAAAAMIISIHDSITIAYN